MKTCKRGHEQTPENVMVRGDGRRECRPCKYARVADYRKREAEAIGVRRRAAYAAAPAPVRDARVAYARTLKAQVVAGYGGACACCGETHPAFLTIDHTNNDGGGRTRENHRKLYRQLIAQGFPRDGYELACFNCNTGRHVNGGVCPHKE